MSWNPKYAILIAASTLVTWVCGLILDRCTSQGYSQKSRKAILLLCLLFNLGILFFFKYYNFAASNINALFDSLHISVKVPGFDILLPVGISFYTFQALGYVLDVYRGDIKVERSLLRYALFVSFFPQLVAGPIERSKNLMSQLYEKHTFDFKRAKDGVLLMAWGFFQKLVIADRIAGPVNSVFNDYTAYTGAQIYFAIMLFAIQIYCDFAGYSDIAVGAARIMGFRLTKNFKSPYIVTSIKGYWAGWHISLTNWFKDYVYIPLGGNRKGKFRKHLNILITFSVSGLWHGANWNYIVWGCVNGIYQVVGDITRPYRKKALGLLKINEKNPVFNVFQWLITMILINFSLLFFRANSLDQALDILRYGISNFQLASMYNPDTFLRLHTMGMYGKEFYMMIFSSVLLLIVDFFRIRVDLKAILARRNIVIRWFVYFALIFSILIFGIYGPEYDAAAFIYFQF